MLRSSRIPPAERFDAEQISSSVLEVAVQPLLHSVICHRIRWGFSIAATGSSAAGFIESSETSVREVSVATSSPMDSTSSSFPNATSRRQHDRP